MAKPEFEIRIVGHGVKAAKDFLANPLNWKIHSQFAQDGMDEALSEVGWVEEVTVNVRTGNLVDGHRRVTVALRRGEDTPVPYKEVDLSPEEEAFVLATLDPLGGLSIPDPDLLAQVLGEINTGGPNILEMIDQMAEDAGAIHLAPLDTSAPGSDKKPGRDLGNVKAQIKPVLYAEQVERFEAALRMTGIINRGDALMAVCQFYIDHLGVPYVGNAQSEERQFDLRA